MSRDHCTVGQVNIIEDSVKIWERRRCIGSRQRERFLTNKAGRFFKEFTPIFHISVKTGKNRVEVVYTDLRYYIKNRFMHHATAVYNGEGKLEYTFFHPYRKSNTVRF